MNQLNCQPSNIPHNWQAFASGQAELRLAAEVGAMKGPGEVLKMEYDFHGGGGFVVARCVCPIQMPESFRIRFRIRGWGERNHFEVKLVDAGGKNVWRHQMLDFQLPSEEEEISVSSREFDFAWGPAGGGVLREMGALEIAVVAGPGGRGVVWIGDFSIVDTSFSHRPQIMASSAQKRHRAEYVMVSGKHKTWRSVAEDKAPWMKLDAGEAREFGGLTIHWETAAPSTGYTVEVSNDGEIWKLVNETSRAGGKTSWISLPGAASRWIRMRFRELVGIEELRVESFEFSRSPTAFWHTIASQLPAGWHPRWLQRLQSLWTPLSYPQGPTCGVMNEQGLVEWTEAAFSLEPVLLVGGKLITWADVTISQGLTNEWMPIPFVKWSGASWELRVEAHAAASGAVSMTCQFKNVSGKIGKVQLGIAIRPFQVIPPWQAFRKSGGVAPIHCLELRKGTVFVDEQVTLRVTASMAQFGAVAFADGPLYNWLERGELPPYQSVQDASGFASGALLATKRVEKKGSFSVSVLVQQAGKRIHPSKAPKRPWGRAMPWRKWDAAEPEARDALLAGFAATAQILATRDGPALQPGPRRYTRSWIRDGTLMCAALLRMRIHRPVAEFIRWYAPHQRQDGFVPCCVDRDGPDWIVEHDSHGQFVALVADYVAFTGDTVLLAEMWPRVQSAVACLENLIEPSGLLPISASHEGYLAHPVHSYWDDFWALRAFSDAASLADRMGFAELASQWRQRASSFRTGLFASIRQTMEQKKLDYIPGSVEWADFDPTATANAIAMLELSPEIPAVTIHATFDKYMTDWRRKRTGDLDWTNYTPYEIRIMAALVRLGRRADALELLRFFLSDRRPAGWHQWPEIGWRDPNAPAHIGDVPHTWIGAEYLLALRSFFVWEDELRHRLVLAAGLPWEWLSGPGVRIVKMPTLYGNLTYTLRRINPDTVQFELSEMRKSPKGGVVLQLPLAHKVTRVAKLIGRRPDQHPDGFHFRTLPVRVRFHYSPDHTL